MKFWKSERVGDSPALTLPTRGAGINKSVASAFVEMVPKYFEAAITHRFWMSRKRR